jgi:predicted small lipoprotein YifL
MSKLRPALAAAALMVTLVACGSGGPAARPSTGARLSILSPTADQVTGPDVTLRFDVTGGTVLPPAQVKGPLRGDQGHIHVSLDGKLVQMAYATQAQLNGLTPGPHTVQASWVATDHLPFANRVAAVVLFQVKP